MVDLLKHVSNGLATVGTGAAKLMRMEDVPKLTPALRKQDPLVHPIIKTGGESVIPTDVTQPAPIDTSAPTSTPEPVVAPVEAPAPIKATFPITAPTGYSQQILRQTPAVGFVEGIIGYIAKKPKYAQNKVYLILEDDNTVHTYMVRHTVKITPGPTGVSKSFYWLAYNGYNYDAAALLKLMKTAGVAFKGNESCNFFFIERDHTNQPGTLSVCKVKFTERAAHEIENAERSKLKDRVAERLYFGISKRWRPQALGDDMMKILVFGIVIMLITWVVLTNLPGVLSVISENVAVRPLIANTTNSVVGFIGNNATHVTST